MDVEYNLYLWRAFSHHPHYHPQLHGKPTVHNTNQTTKAVPFVVASMVNIEPEERKKYYNRNVHTSTLEMHYKNVVAKRVMSGMEDQVLGLHCYGIMIIIFQINIKEYLRCRCYRRKSVGELYYYCSLLQTHKQETIE